MCFKSEIAVLMQWVSLTFSRRLGSSEWLLDRRLTAVSLNNWKRETHFGDLILVCQGKEAVCRYLMARLFSLTSLPVGETATSWYLTVSAVGSEILATLTFFSMAFSSPFSFSSALIAKCRPGRSKASAFFRLFYHQSSRLCAGWQDGDVRGRGDFTALPPLLLKRPPENNEIWCCNKVVEKAVFQWCYLSCSVPTPCNDDLSLFSVMCSIFIYDQASFSLYFFGFITHFFCAIPATNEKIKKRNILCAVSNTFSVA